MRLPEWIRTKTATFMILGAWCTRNCGPTRRYLPVVEYIPPGVFERYRDMALQMGVKAVASFPLARSSMNAEKMVRKWEEEYQKRPESVIVNSIKMIIKACRCLSSRD